jgi:hypothetical protein
MSQQEIDQFFTEYVFGFMATDVRREIEQARGGKDGGNFLCALGLCATPRSSAAFNAER